MEIRDRTQPWALRGQERSAPGAAGARPRGGSAGMLFASPKAANSSGGWLLAPPPARRGSLTPADTGVTGQAPNHPAERGEVAFAVTRSHPRRHRRAAQGHCPGWGPGDPAVLGLGWSLGARQAPGKGWNLQEWEKSRPVSTFA